MMVLKKVTQTIIQLSDVFKCFECNFGVFQNLAISGQYLIALKDNESFMKIYDKLTHMEDNIAKTILKLVLLIQMHII